MRRSTPFLTAACMVLALLVAAGVVSCSRSERQTRTRPDAPGAVQHGEKSLHGEGPHVLEPGDRIVWNYESTPTPDPGIEPSYLLRSFVFERGSYSLNAEARGVLKELAGLMEERPQVELLLLSFCDKATENVNAANLGLQRSRAARDALVSHGIARDRMKMATFGAALARADANEPVGQERDRRVEVWLITE